MTRKAFSDVRLVIIIFLSATYCLAHIDLVSCDMLATVFNVPGFGCKHELDPAGKVHLQVFRDECRGRRCGRFQGGLAAQIHQKVARLQHARSRAGSQSKPNTMLCVHAQAITAGRRMTNGTSALLTCLVLVSVQHKEKIEMVLGKTRGPPHPRKLCQTTLKRLRAALNGNGFLLRQRETESYRTTMFLSLLSLI